MARKPGTKKATPAEAPAEKALADSVGATPALQVPPPEAETAAATHLRGYTELTQPATVTARVARRRIGRNWQPGDQAIIDLDLLSPLQSQQLFADGGFDVSFDFD